MFTDDEFTQDELTDGRAGAPLGGLRVLDFTHAAAGPFATMLLGDLGAEVIKIESPRRGDGARYMGEDTLGSLRPDYYIGLNRNKKSVLADFSTPEGRDLVTDLARHCDVVVENFRPGVLDRHGLGFEDLRVVRPGLVYCSISAFGSTGPWRDRPANDIILQSVSGLMSITGEPDGDPVRAGVPICDYSSGLFALVGLLSALRVRDRHPEGQHVEVAMLDASVALLASMVPGVANRGATITRPGSGHPAMVPYQAFRCADDRFLMVGAFTTSFWRRLCEVVERPEWAEDPRFASNADRVAHRDELIGMLAEVFGRRTRAEWEERLGEADIPSSPVLEPAEALRSEQAVHNQVLRRVVGADADGPVADVARTPVRADRWGPAPVAAPPGMGEHTDEVLGTLLGLDREHVDALVEKGVTGRTPPETARKGR